MSDVGDQFAKEIVSDAFDQSIVFVQNYLNSDPNFFVKKLEDLKCVGENPQIEIVIASAAAEHALGAFFSNIELTGEATISVANENGDAADLASVLVQPYLSYFQEGGWLDKFSKNRELALLWQDKI